MKTQVIINDQCIQMILKPDHQFEKDLIESIDRGEYSKSIITQSEGVIEIRFNKNEQKQGVSKIEKKKDYSLIRSILEVLIAVCTIVIAIKLISVL
jgi:hypothetical protein